MSSTGLKHTDFIEHINVESIVMLLHCSPQYTCVMSVHYCQLEYCSHSVVFQYRPMCRKLHPNFVNISLG